MRSSFGDCLEEAAARYGVSPLLLEAMSLVESGSNPLAIGVKAKGEDAYTLKRVFDRAGVPYVLSGRGNYWIFSVFPESKERARWVLKVITDFPVSYDVGLMQVNNLWVKRYGLKPEWLLDSCYAYQWGAFILSRMIDRYGYTWKAVWHYNGRKDYAVKVFKKVKELCREKYRDEPYCALFN